MPSRRSWLARSLVFVTSLAAASVSVGHEAFADRRVHVVGEGENLWNIARGYGCELGAVRSENYLDGTLLHVGQELVIPRCEASEEEPAPAKLSGPLEQHVVAPGDSLFAIAKLYDCSLDDLRSRNHLDGDLIRPGQKLVVLPGSGASAVPIPGQSVGRPGDGRLVHGTRLAPGVGYVLRRPERAFGTNYAVRHIQRAVRSVRARFPKVHALAIGDLSVQGGGKITMHASHQSGRDADLGFYFRRRPASYPEEFVVATRRNLHVEATWALISALLATGDVERIFISYSTQKLLYRLAVDAGISRDELDGIFQYPHGLGSHHGIIRHEPAHDEHLHVRFRCPPDDRGCE